MVSICFNAGDPSVAMSVKQAHQRLGIAEGVIHELQEQLQRVSARHQATNQQLSILRSKVDTRSRVRLVVSKTLMPDRFGKKNGPIWRTWSYLARDFVGVVHATLKQAMKAAENKKQPMTHFQHDFNVTNEMDQELQPFLISRTEGEALEIVRGAEREPGFGTMAETGFCMTHSGRQQANLVSVESCQNRRLLTHHPSLGNS